MVVGVGNSTRSNVPADIIYATASGSTTGFLPLLENALGTGYQVPTNFTLYMSIIEYSLADATGRKDSLVYADDNTGTNPVTLIPADVLNPSAPSGTLIIHEFVCRIPQDKFLGINRTVGNFFGIVFNGILVPN